jgi:hypothetical protein
VFAHRQGESRKDLQPAVRDAVRVESRHGRLSADLHYLEPANDRVVVGRLIEPDDRISDREDGIPCRVLRFVLAYQKRRHLPGCEMHPQALQRARHRRRSGGTRLCGMGQQPEGIDDHNARSAPFHLFDDPLQNSIQTALVRIFAQVEEADALTHLLGVEKAVLLLVPQHLDRWLAQDREEEGGSAIWRRSARRRRS